MGFVESLPIIPLDDIFDEYRGASESVKKIVTALLIRDDLQFLISVSSRQGYDRAQAGDVSADSGFTVYGGQVDIITSLLLNTLDVLTAEDSYKEQTLKALGIWLGKKGAPVLKRVNRVAKQLIEEEETDA